jgi:hypothetical protein
VCERRVDQAVTTYTPSWRCRTGLISKIVSWNLFSESRLWRVRSLEHLELQHNLPPGTARRFKALYDNASCVPEHEEVRYATTWDAYHDVLDNDRNLAVIANAYAQSYPLPLHRRIDATGTVIF